MGIAILKLTVTEFELLCNLSIEKLNMANLKYVLSSITMIGKEIIFEYDTPLSDNIDIEYEIIKNNKRKIITIEFFFIDNDIRVVLKRYYGEDEYNRNAIFFVGCYEKECFNQNIQKRINSFIEKVRPNTLFTINTYIDPNTFEPTDIIDYLEFETIEDKNLFKELIL